ncbi:hypothetical protein QBC46DRAFT_312487 [Diplogelasinospora grovesii]|uniref:Uncharacterized protein n=1 Tax=Diplogelasinospora grovesii TaxID=303347 RepID=A0AAN6S5V9_9PEZI|nr:hypothetical protein QBC46DRAFT_312487 [Diplogelasinospora grovesii]
MMESEKGEEEINVCFTECQYLFRNCLQLPAFHDDSWLDDRAADFNVWASAIKADTTGRPSLDYRLRNWPEVGAVIVDLLTSLRETLKKCLDHGGKSSLTKSLAATTPAEKSPEQSPVDEPADVWSDFSDDSGTAQQPDESRAFEQLPQEKVHISTTIDQLTRLSLAIKRSGNRRRAQKADESFDENRYEDLKRHLVFLILIGHSQSNLAEGSHSITSDPQINDTLQLTVVQRRLVHQNLLRHHRIQYATRTMADSKARSPDANVNKDSKKYSSLFSDFQDKGKQPAGQQLQSLQPVVAAKPSQSSQRNTAASVSFTATELGSQFDLPVPERRSASRTTVSRIGARQDYPKCPTSKGLFNCPYCCQTLSGEDLSAKSGTKWKGHVAQDILPYACIFEECEQAEELYAASNEWYTHMRNEHSTSQWLCDICPPVSRIEGRILSFESGQDWENHVIAEHPTAFPLEQIHVLAELAQRSAFVAPPCPLCLYAPEPGKKNEDNHTATHLHEFALRGLPGNADGRSTRSSGSEVAHSHIHDLDSDEEGDASFGNASIGAKVDRMIDIAWELEVDSELRVHCTTKVTEYAYILSQLKATTNTFRHRDLSSEVELEYEAILRSLTRICELLNQHIQTNEVDRRKLEEAEEELRIEFDTLESIIDATDASHDSSFQQVSLNFQEFLNLQRSSEDASQIGQGLSTAAVRSSQKKNRSIFTRALGKFLPGVHSPIGKSVEPVNMASNALFPPGDIRSSGEITARDVRECTKLVRQIVALRFDCWTLRNVNKPDRALELEKRKGAADYLILDLQSRVEFWTSCRSTWGDEDYKEVAWIAHTLAELRLHFFTEGCF